jgi:hypothetical protein
MLQFSAMHPYCVLSKMGSEGVRHLVCIVLYWTLSVSHPAVASLIASRDLLLPYTIGSTL